MKTLALSIAVLLFVGYPLSQTRTFRWSDEACSYLGAYDASRLSEQALVNTLKLSRPGSFSLETSTTAWKYADIARLDGNGLDREYRQKRDQLAALNVVKTPYWEEFKLSKIRELDQVYELSRATMRGYTNPKALLEYAHAPGCTMKYARPLIAGGDELIKTWRRVNEDAREKNVDPERLRRIFDQQMRSPERMNHALLEVMSFGWFNCANENIEYIHYDGTPDAEFQKLFSSVRKLRCNLP